MQTYIYALQPIPNSQSVTLSITVETHAPACIAAAR